MILIPISLGFSLFTCDTPQDRNNKKLELAQKNRISASQICPHFGTLDKGDWERIVKNATYNPEADPGRYVESGIFINTASQDSMTLIESEYKLAYSALSIGPENQYAKLKEFEYIYHQICGSEEIPFYEKIPAVVAKRNEEAEKLALIEREKDKYSVWLEDSEYIIQMINKLPKEPEYNSMTDIQKTAAKEKYMESTERTLKKLNGIHVSVKRVVLEDVHSPGADLDCTMSDMVKMFSEKKKSFYPMDLRCNLVKKNYYAEYTIPLPETLYTSDRWRFGGYTSGFCDNPTAQDLWAELPKGESEINPTDIHPKCIESPSGIRILRIISSKAEAAKLKKGEKSSLVGSLVSIEVIYGLGARKIIIIH